MTFSDALARENSRLVRDNGHAQPWWNAVIIGPAPLNAISASPAAIADREHTLLSTWRNQDLARFYAKQV